MNLTTDELATVGAAVEDALFRMHGVVSSCDGTAEAEIIAPTVERIVEARLAAVGDELEALCDCDAFRANDPEWHDPGCPTAPLRAGLHPLPAAVAAGHADTSR